MLTSFFRSNRFLSLASPHNSPLAGFYFWRHIASTAGAVFTLVSVPAAQANRPLLAAPPMIINLRLALPIPIEEAMRNDFLGIDQEDAAAGTILNKNAAEYIELRTGRDKLAALAWYLKCETHREDANPNPFCTYEFERRSKTSPRPLSKARARIEAHGVASGVAQQIRSENYDRVATSSFTEVIGAVRQLEHSGQIDAVVENVMKHDGCVAPTLTTALAYKLEERFPAPDVIVTAQTLYHKAAACGHDLAAAQANYRLALIDVWQHHCESVGELMGHVEMVPEASQYHSRAKYWRHYCAGQLGDGAGQQAARESLLKSHPMSFHALAVAGQEAMGVSPIFTEGKTQIALRSLVRPDLNPMIRASEALLKAGANALAAEMLDRHVRDIGSIEPEVRLYLAILLNRIGATLPEFKILAELFQNSPKSVNLTTLRLYFPLAYLDLARASGGAVDPLLILSLIRQESAFNKEARSIAGARGLMQVMPLTARTVSAVRSTKRLLDPAVNIGVGTKYFSQRLEKYGGDVELTLAAYNAGFARVEEWKRRYPTDNRMLFLDFIPFRETRDYVSSILRNYYWYTKLYSNPDAPSPLATAARAPASEGKLTLAPLNEKIAEHASVLTDKFTAILNANAGQAFSNTVLLNRAKAD